MFYRATFLRRGFVISSELILVAIVVVIGLIAALVAVRNSVVAELSDTAGAVADLNQSFSVNGSTSVAASTAGSSFSDNIDSANESGDPSGLADNGILFDVDPADEGEGTGSGPGGGGPGGGGVSAVGTFSFDPFTPGGSATGTIGDGTINTGFTTTGSGPGIVTGTAGNDVLFTEEPSMPGSITTTFDDPLTEVEVFFSSLTNDGLPHQVGNFTVTLSDGTTINNASFSVLPDAISPNAAVGPFFTAQNDDRDTLSGVTSGGNQFVIDGTNNGSGIGLSQAAGRIVFTDPAITGAPAGVGISSITFERSGGQAGFTSRFSVSGRVNQ